MRPQLALRDNRHFVRVEVTLPALLREYGSSQRFAVDIKDMSLVGLRFETSFTLQLGAQISVIIPGLAPLEAVIAWGTEYRYGCAFHRALHIAVFDHIVARYRKLETQN